MRLLHYINDSDFGFTEFFESDIPKYAILSHRWGAEEVTFKDLVGRKNEGMIGNGKIRFCGEQAKCDGLQYFWVDTCCIDKSNSTELAEAINSMFVWYRNATRCYVYLPDVSRLGFDSASKSDMAWESSFRKSEWFTRGWTLQELVAPTSVEFFSSGKELLGDKVSLEQQISEITGIPIDALQGGRSLSSFSVTERMLWAASRVTYRAEDKAYSLLGIFDVKMPLIYGEGKDKALQRLREEIDKALKGSKREDFSVVFSLSSVSNVERFVGRESELMEMHKELSSNGSRKVVVLHGLGGMGKTQLSVAYAKRYKDSYSAILWLNVKDENSLKQSFIQIAKQLSRQHPSALRLSNIDTQESIDQVVDDVKAWLSRPNNTRWLMIFDNYDNPKLPRNSDSAAMDIKGFLPESYQGSIIITTRSAEVRLGHSIRIKKLEDVHDSIEILSHFSKRERLSSDPDAAKLAEELDGLPLALATAGAYLDQVAVSLSDYLRLYKQSWVQLLKSSPELDSYEDRALYSTWKISFDHVKQQNDLSAKLLCFWAYFDSRDLWLELLQHSDSNDPDWVRELTKDEISFHQAVRVLSNHGLVEVENSSQDLIESQGYSIHGCVHSWTIHVLNQVWDHELARLAMKFVSSHVPGDYSSRLWLTSRRLLQHAMRCSHMFLNRSHPKDSVAVGCFNLGKLYSSQHKLVEAEQMYRRALQDFETTAPHRISKLVILCKLGDVCLSQGHLMEAEQAYQLALLYRENTISRDHIGTFRIVYNLGILYHKQGKLAEAEQMYLWALQSYEKIRGLDDTWTLEIVGDLGKMYASQGKLAEAEQMYQRVLQGYKKTTGIDHVLILETFNSLGVLYVAQGKLVEAEQMYQRVLQGYEETIGVQDSWMLEALNNLAALYSKQGKLVESEKLCQRALQGYKKTTGLDDMFKFDIFKNLAVLYTKQGKLVEAEQMYQQVLQGYEEILGPDHVMTLRIAKDLGNFYIGQGKRVEAKQMLERVLQGYRESADKKNTSSVGPTLDTFCALGKVFELQADMVKARAMYLKAFVGYEKEFGPDHSETRKLRHKLCELDAVVESKSMVGPEQPIEDHQGEPSYTSIEPISSNSKQQIS